jgi:hypothetical protein
VFEVVEAAWSERSAVAVEVPIVTLPPYSAKIEVEAVLSVVKYAVDDA